MLDPVKNFVQAEVNGLYDADDSEINIIIVSGELPDPETDGAFNLVYWNFSDYPNPANDPLKEIVRVTGREGNTLTILRAQENTLATVKNFPNKKYMLTLSFTEKSYNDIREKLDELETLGGAVKSVNEKVGDVALTTDDIPSVPNKRYATDTQLENLETILTNENRGEQGLPGTSRFIYIAYANDFTGQGFTTNPLDTPIRKFIGILNIDHEVAEIDLEDAFNENNVVFFNYLPKKYTYISYASDNIGTDFSDVFDPAVHIYMGIITTDDAISLGDGPVAEDYAGVWMLIGGSGGEGTVGPQGPQGETGPIGAQGIPGPKGDKGDTGNTGAQGIQGVAGPAGADGAPGADGADGTFADVASLTELTTPEQSNDWLVIWDTSTSAYKKIKPIYFQQLFEAWSQTEEDSLYALYHREGFPISIIRADLQGSTTFVIANSSSTSSAENISLSGSGGTFSIADLASVSSIENIVLTMNGGTFAISDASSASSSENVALTALNEFVVSDSSSASSSENVALALGGGTLAVADASSASSEENVVIEQYGVYDFNGAADSAIPSFFDARTAGSGVVRINGSGGLQVKAPSSTTDAAVAWRNDAITLAQSKTYKVKVKVNSATTLGAGMYCLSVINAINKYCTDSTTAFGATFAAITPISIQILNSSGTPYFKIGYTNGSLVNYYYSSGSWSTTNANTIAISFDTYYNLSLITTSTTFRVLIKSADDSTTIIDTGTVNISSLRSRPNTDFLLIGDAYSNANSGEIEIDSYLEQ